MENSSPLGLRTPELGELHVLFVDDSPDERELFPLRFGHHFGEIVTVGTVAEALAEIARGELDVVLADIGLPDESGLDLVRQMRALPAIGGGALPAVAVTGRVTVLDRSEALAAGFIDVVAKPYRSSTLIDAVASVVPAVEALRALRRRLADGRRAQRALRASLVARAAALRDERARLAFRYGSASEREAAKRMLVESAARVLATPYFACGELVVKVLGATLYDGGRERWAVAAMYGGEQLLINVVVNTTGVVDAYVTRDRSGPRS